MQAIITPVVALLVSTAILIMGNGLQTILLPVRADLEHFSDLAIGLLGSGYYLGLMAGCLICPRAIVRVGHIRAFTAFTAMATLVPLAHAVWPNPLVWILLRLVTGACFAGLTMVIESWLNGAATNDTRGRILSFYTMINLSVSMAGQLLLTVSNPKGFELFSLVAALISLAAVPVTLTTSPAPPAPKFVRLDPQSLFRASAVGVFGCLLAGFANGAFWSLGPVFARDVGLSVGGIALFMSAAVLGGTLLQWPIGFISDHGDRRKVIAVSSAGAAIIAFAIAMAPFASPVIVIVLAFGFGALNLPLYSISVAHANDRIDKGRAVEVSGGLLLVYAFGATVGPLLAASLMNLTDRSALFLYMTGVEAALAVFTLTRLGQRKAPTAESKDQFVAVPGTSPVVFDLDPRAQTDTPAGQDIRTDKEQPPAA